VEPFVLVARTIDVDKKTLKTNPPILEVEGYIESRRVTSDGTLYVVVDGLVFNITETTEIPDDIFQKALRIEDDEEDRPDRQFVLFDRLIIGGEVQADFEYKDDYDLDKHANEDTFIVDTSATIEGLFRIAGRSHLFARARTAKPYVIFDEDRDLHLVERTALDELYAYWDQVFGLPLALQVGRQDFDEEREWIYDENLDAARLFLDLGRLEVEYSWSTYLADTPRAKGNLFNQILMARWRYSGRSYFAAYVVDVQDHSRFKVSPFFVGFRVYGRSKEMRYWIDYAYLDGVSGTTKLEGHGLDLGFAYQWRKLPLQPYAFVGYAMGTGDGKASGRTDRAFRQTGYHDNNDKTFGVASYRYYGELLRPELSNLEIGTVGVGVRPHDSTSVDVIFHWYNQRHRSSTLRDSSLRASPSGLDTDIGNEIDVVVGVDDLWGRVDIELDFGYFTPGDAFLTDDHPALWTAVQLEWTF
ncbi:MAG: alginate export family protein, partial [Planctomycetes bacterium]|nr:alginate export family protein [Planctomycetota bacterium]